MHYHLNHNPHQFFTYHLILDEKHVLTCAKLSSFLPSSFGLAMCFYRHESSSTPRIKVVRFGVEELFNSAKGTLLLHFLALHLAKGVFRMIVLLFSSATKKIMRILIHQAYLSDPNSPLAFLHIHHQQLLMINLANKHSRQMVPALTDTRTHAHIKG